MHHFNTHKEEDLALQASKRRQMH